MSKLNHYTVSYRQKRYNYITQEQVEEILTAVVWSEERYNVDNYINCPELQKKDKEGPSRYRIIRVNEVLFEPKNQWWRDEDVLKQREKAFL